MDLVIDFIVENYIWFIVGAIVLLMIIIGFIAEKTDFGRKPFSSKKKEKVENKEESEDSAVEEMVNAEETNHDDSVEANLDEAIDSSAVSEESATIDEEPMTIPVEDVEPSTDSSEDLNAPFGDQDVVKAVEEETSDIPDQEETSEDDVWKF